MTTVRRYLIAEEYIRQLPIIDVVVTAIMKVVVDYFAIDRVEANAIRYRRCVGCFRLGQRETSQGIRERHVNLKRGETKDRRSWTTIALRNTRNDS